MTVFDIPLSTAAVGSTTAALGRERAAYGTSPFAGAALSADEAPSPTTGYGREFGAGPGSSLTTPFVEAFARLDEHELEARAVDALRAEFADEDFENAVQALVDEAAARHLVAAGTWGQQSEALSLADSEVEQWMETVAARADRLLGELESHFGPRPVESLAEGEIEAVAGFSGTDSFTPTGGPLDAQEMFLGKLIGKVTKVVKGVVKVVKKGVSALGKLSLGPLFGVLKKLVRPLLQRVLQKAIGKLPAALQPIARKLVARFGGPAAATAKGQPPAAGGEPASGAATPPTPDAAPADAAAGPAADPGSGETGWSAEALAEDFDARVAEAVLAPHPAAAEAVLAGYAAEAGPPASFADGPYGELDAGRRRLARRLIEAEPGRPPVAEVEEFVPVVMAAMKLIKLGVKVIGRKKVVAFVAKLLATLIQGMVGQQAATQLSQHVADAGLRLLGLEAERAADGQLGAEALVATTEDTIREVLALPEASLANELLLEAAVQEAFTAAAVRHVPAALLRADLRETDGEAERGIWMMFPRAAGGHYRYKKYSLVEPLQITRPMARTMIFAEGESLEDRLLEAGARTWPVPAEAHFYELLPGAELGHLAAFEALEDEGEAGGVAQAATEFEELARPLPFAHPRSRPAGGNGPHPGASGPRRPLHPGARFFRLRVAGVQPRRRHPFSVRFDLAGGKPALAVHLHVGERVAHELVGHLEKRDLVAVVAVVRRLVGDQVRDALADKLRRTLGRHGVTLAEDASRRLARELAEAIARTVADQLAAAAAALTSAAKDAAPGVTLSFAFSFADTAALGQGKAGDPTLRIRSGVHRD